MKRDIDKMHVPNFPKSCVSKGEFDVAMRGERYQTQRFVWAEKDVDHLATVGYDLNGMAIGYQDDMSGGKTGTDYYLFT